MTIMTSLPINLLDLLHQRHMESERIEYKSGWNPEAVLRSLITPAVTTEVIKFLMTIQGEMMRSELQDKLALKNEEHFRKAYLVKSMSLGFVEITLPNKPNSRLQKYRLTPQGKAYLQQMMKATA